MNSEAEAGPSMEAVRPTEAHHKDLAGYVQCSGLQIGADLEWRVAAVFDESRGDLFDFVDMRAVVVETRQKGSDGEWFKCSPIFFERPLDPDLRSMAGLAEYLESIIEGPLPERYSTEARWGDYDFEAGRWLKEPDWPEFEALPEQLIFDQTVALRTVIADVAREPVTAERLANLLDCAYALGRMVRERELKARFEAVALAGQNRSQSSRPGGNERGKRRKAEADENYETYIQFVQEVVASLSPTRKPIPYGKLADLVSKRTEELAALAGLRVSYDRDYLARVLLPDWEKKGKYARPVAS